MEREATGPGVLLELRHRFDSARELAQSFCGTVSPGPGSRLTASSDGCHSGNEREKKITRTVGSVKRRRSQGRRKRSWRWQRGKESERARIRHSGRKSVDRGERGSAHRPQQLARLCSSVSGLAPALGLQGSHPKCLLERQSRSYIRDAR